MTYTFAIPTIMNDPEMEIKNVEKIAKEYPDSKVFFISNVKDKVFESYTPTYNNIVKLVGGLKYSISRALNKSIEHMDDTDFFVFVQSDVTFERSTLESLTNATLADNNCGVIGVTQRSNFHKFNKKVNLVNNLKTFKVLWTDGIMFMRGRLAKEFKFDEIYFGDKESQDFCYRVHDAGYNNYLVPNQRDAKHQHVSKSFDNKLKEDKQEFLETVKETRNLFKNRWREWEETQRHMFA